jgi:hypothetical protein
MLNEVAEVNVNRVHEDFENAVLVQANVGGKGPPIGGLS